MREEMYIDVLREYPIEFVREAFREYIKGNSDVPAPADIQNLLEKSWKFSSMRSDRHRLCQIKERLLNPPEPEEELVPVDFSQVLGII